MITLSQIAEQYIRDVSGGDQSKDSQVDRREVIVKIRQLMNQLLMGSYFQKWNEGDRSATTMYIASYELTINKSEDERYYVDLPEFYVSLPYNRGIHRVFRKGSPENGFTPQHNYSVSDRVNASRVNSIDYYYVEGLRVFLRGKHTVQKDGKIVAQLIVAAPDSVGENDPLPIIPEHQSVILQALKQGYLPTKQDRLNNDRDER
jgi:hypothetical protein